jgi:hypothetical protein
MRAILALSDILAGSVFQLGEDRSNDTHDLIVIDNLNEHVDMFQWCLIMLDKLPDIAVAVLDFAALVGSLGGHRMVVFVER